MGSERKSKEKSRKRSGDYVSQSEDEGQAKRHKTSDEYGEDSSRRRDKKDKSRHTKSHKHSKRKEKKHKTESSKSGRHSKSDLKELSNDDYYSKNNEFATWLKEEKRKFFSDLSSDSARELFSEFVEDWNSKKLESKYYKGIDTAPRSSHKWKIKS